ncbi:hypothetical protein GLI01_14460 [Gluconacetobacter liquefaciens]|uniref:Uncharacterized protein n=1 Tax=Gluconacetobacter liquefaciens TaxID=89584 RepID=A0A370G9S5_GLULI|nr:hypothetical protein [Gluconacetobacter liquefaciens]MBB2185052.1 hypothetical protein [Gluconacetobacter liquefaciens]RDI40481.1 hypothetical protein C7453_101275 [Gluconacetobacter liquefaciens]GEB37411.1 hypothetical protein GLI01_14460 [Gluconacetobacter liquefaciens]
MARDEQDETLPYPSSFARTNARLGAALDRGALILTAPIRRMGLNFTPADPDSQTPRLAPKLWIVLTACAVATGIAAWQILSSSGWTTIFVWTPILISLSALTSFRSRHPIVSKPADERTEAERRIVGQCWLAAAITIAALSYTGLILTALHVATAPLAGPDLARRILIGLFFIEYMAFMAPVVVLSWHDRRPDDQTTPASCGRGASMAR